MINNISNYTKFNTINDINLELPDTLKFHWNLLFMCNYHCSFCYAREQEWNRLLKPDKIDSVINFFSKEYYKQYNYVLVTFLFDSNYQKEHLEILKYCKENNITCYGSFIFHKDQIKKIDTSTEYFKLIEPFLIKNLVYDNKDNIKFNEIQAYNQNLHYFKNWNCNNKTFDIPLEFNNVVNQFCSDIEYNIDMLNNNDFVYKCQLEQCVCPARNNNAKFI